MKRQIVNIVAGLASAAIAVALVGTLVFSHSALHRTVIGTADSTVSAAATDTLPSPSDTPQPTPPQVATIANPLPSHVAVVVQPAPPQATPPPPVTTPSPDPSPSPSDSPTPPPPSPSPLPTPTPTPPPCSWSVVVSTLSDPSTSTWTVLGTWNASASTSSSPVFVMAGTGWLSYDYQFAAVCIGHAKLVSTYYATGTNIYTSNINSASLSTQQANLPPNTEVIFTVTLS